MVKMPAEVATRSRDRVARRRDAYLVDRAGHHAPHGADRVVEAPVVMPLLVECPEQTGGVRCDVCEDRPGVLFGEHVGGPGPLDAVQGGLEPGPPARGDLDRGRRGVQEERDALRELEAARPAARGPTGL